MTDSLPESPESAGSGRDPQAAARLRQLGLRASTCTECGLSSSRSRVVFGSGPESARVMLVGEAPGREEDLEGIPFVGRSGRLLTELLEQAGIGRGSVYIANVVCCRPPGNRDPLGDEIAACSPWLASQMELVDPDVVCTLGNFATKLMRCDPTGITKLHGCDERRVIAGRERCLYPMFHPAAALRSKSTMQLLAADVARLPEVLAASRRS